MANTYTELIEQLRSAAKIEQATCELEGIYESGHVKMLREAADAIETLSSSIETYAKANAELTAWKSNAQEWMQKVAEEKEKAAADMRSEPDPAPAHAPDVLYICDRRACNDCNIECNHTSDPRHAKHFELDGDALFEQEG